MIHKLSPRIFQKKKIAVQACPKNCKKKQTSNFGNFVASGSSMQVLVLENDHSPTIGPEKEMRKIYI